MPTPTKPFTKPARRARRAVLILAAAFAALLSPLGITPVQAAVPTTPYSSLTNQFQNYGNSSGAWNGADGAESLKLPDGRVLWFFNDTYHGPVNPDGTRRPFQSRFLRNSLVIQNGSAMSTVTGSANGPSSLVEAAVPGEWLWGGDQMLSGGTVYKFYQRIAPVPPPCQGDFCFRVNGAELVAMPVATITDPTTYRKVPVPSPADCVPGVHCTLWGTALVSDATYTYLYNTEYDHTGGVLNKYLHLARVPKGQFTGTWEYWNGSTWSTDPAQSARMMNGVSEGFSVTYTGGRYVLITQGLTGALAGNMEAYYSATPTGFNGGNKTVLHMTRETTTDTGNWTYEYRLVPHLSSGNTVVVAYSVNSLYVDGACTAQNYWQANLYRPRFVQFTLPATAQGGAYISPTKAPPGAPWTMTRPDYCTDNTKAAPAPTNVKATALTGAAIKLSWTRPTPGGKWSYEGKWRDATAGQAWSDWVLFTPDADNWTPALLAPGHKYEFQMRAVAWSGAVSAWLPVVSAVAQP
ncbi:DUF5005 domain-containing protein [Yinghuangia soli]|uniref:DUF5005 domain-containing protein n=1 Tax=Yinghuangia soli TaxID=2908204 RepID=A0AA41U594_9ACTN|nr:DUF5005 domain-containing protein [Yinghuangia soli]MCF2531677.1 DUF5005 domain-containing protein [Yinghuangia soli]